MVKIAIDVDGVVADFDRRMWDLAKSRFGTQMPARFKPPTDWNWKSWKLTEVQVSELWEEVRGIKDFWLQLKPLPFTIDLRLPQKWAEFVFITSRVPSGGAPVGEQTAEWLYRNFGLRWPHVIVASNKGEVCRALHVDVFIDDKPSNCTDVQENSPGTRVFLCKAPHNANWTPPVGIERVENFDSFLERIRLENREK